MKIKIYTDGACIGNPGPGGWAAIILENDVKKEIFGGEKSTTNNRMELTAAIKALQYLAIKKTKYLYTSIAIYTDSQYVKNGITTWVKKWEENNWKTADRKKVKNVDLWKQLRELARVRKIEWKWIKGHSNNTMNDLVDKIAKRSVPV